MKFKKNIIFHNYYTALNDQNFMFEHDDAPGIGEGLLKPLRVIRERAREQEISVGTHDFFSAQDTIDAYFFLDLPKKSDPVFIEAKNSGKPLYLVLMESPIIRPNNYKKENHVLFEKIFTWDSRLVDNKKYFKICIPQNPSPGIWGNGANERKLVTLIASKKKSTLPGELYSKRIEAIEFFERHHKEHFDLYGNSWDKDVYTDTFKILNVLNRLPWKMPFQFQPRYEVYRGKIDSKLEVLSRYKFSICFENFSNARGYITEKIFDSFYAGCVPVYWGAPDVKEYIPSECFVDMRDFSTFFELFAYLDSMPEKEFIQYQESICRFLQSEEYKVFLPDFFADFLLGNLYNFDV